MPKQLLNDTIRSQVRDLFKDLKEPVRVLYWGSDDPDICTYCQDTQDLLQEVVDLSEKLSLEIHDMVRDNKLAKQYQIDAVPAFAICGLDDHGVIDFGVRYKGIPSGHEFSSLVNDLVLVSKRDSGLAEETREYLRTLDKPVHLQVFVTPT